MERMKRLFFYTENTINRAIPSAKNKKVKRAIFANLLPVGNLESGFLGVIIIKITNIIKSNLSIKPKSIGSDIFPVFCNIKSPNVLKKI